MKKSRRIFFFLLLLSVVLIAVDLPENFPLNGIVLNPVRLDIQLLGLRLRKDFKTHLGLDLAGGTQVTMEADMQDIAAADRSDALESAREIIERRVNFFGVAEPVVQSVRTSDRFRILVELPGVTDVDDAIRLIGQTARLEFREFSDPAIATGAAFTIPTTENTTPVGVTGGDLKRASLAFSPETGEPQIAIEFTPEGATKFEEVTTRLVGKLLPIFLDDMPLSAPMVQSAIKDSGVITGSFTRETARALALQLNAGALPVPVGVVEKRTVGATLGAESVQKSVRAGLIGLAVVAIFMIAQYGWLGLIADMALVLYGLLTLALFRMIPVTLTLPGIAGFLLSIGMAVDSNILIFERYKEERRSGKPWGIAMELGFGKAWESIRDANFTTLLTCIILYNPGNWQVLPSSGMVRGFAVTLFLGVLTSLFTGIVVTRTFVRVLYKGKR